MLGCIVFAFAALGVELFGGLINRDPAAPQYAILNQTDFGAAEYWPNSCNDLASCCVVNFELLIVNNWQVVADGYAAVTTQWAKLYFVSFWFVAVLICLNIVVAFALDAFHDAAGDAEAEEARAARGHLRRVAGDGHAHRAGGRVQGVRVVGGAAARGAAAVAAAALRRAADRRAGVSTRTS